MNFREIKDILFAAAGAAGLTEYDAYYRTATDLSAEAQNREAGAAAFGSAGGVTFRCVVEGKLGAASTECLTKEELAALVPRAMANAGLVDADELPILYRPDEKDCYTAPTAIREPLPTMGELRRVSMALQEGVYTATPLAADGTESAAGAAEITVALANSHGLSLSHTATMRYAFVEAVVSRDGEPSFGVASAPSLTVDTLAARATEDALARLGAGAVKTGKYTVVFSAKQMRALLSTYSGIFSGKNALLGLSLLKGREGEQVAAPCVTLYDDPFYKDNTMQMPFDAEGVPTYKKALLAGGVLQTLLYDLTTARKAGKKTTGNARRGSYADAVSISPYCLALAAGEGTLDELFARVGTGIYVTELKGLHAGCDAATGDYSIEAAGFLVENGRRAAPVRSFTIAGNFYDLMKNITAIGGEVESGLCGFSMTAAPAVAVCDVSVAGEA